MTNHRVDQIDRRKKIVAGATGEGRTFEFAYDHLLIATGASAIVPDQPGFNLPGVMTVKDLQDARRIKKQLQGNAVRNIVIIGMGYIALEMCEALRALDLAVDMVKPRPIFLPWLEQTMAAIVREEIEANHVGIHTGHAVHKIEKENDRLRVDCEGVTFIADMVLVGIGVEPNSQFAQKAGLSLGPEKAISVDRRLRTSDPHILAAGDCADAYHVVTGKKTWIPLALRANRAGWAAADNVCGIPAELQGVAGTSVFRVFDMQVAATGMDQAQSAEVGFDPVSNMIKSASRAHSYGSQQPIWVNMTGDRKTGRLLGVQIIGKEGVAHRINAAAVALHAGMTVEEFSQTDLAYAPPFGPTWDPCLTAANQLLKKL